MRKRIIRALLVAGLLANGRPQLQIHLIAANLVGYVQVGRVVPVRYLPANEDDVVLALPANPRV